MQQRSEAWYRARAGRITGSRFSRAVASRHTDTWQNLVSELAEERRTGRSRDGGYLNAAMRWGITHEPGARAWYCREHDRRVDEVGFIVHAEHDFVGVSPDGLVGVDGLIEIKCPQLPNFRRVAKSRQVPSRYRWQVQGQLWVCRRQWLDFVCFYPPGRGVVIHVEADEDDFDRIESCCIDVDRAVRQRLGIGSRPAPVAPATAAASPVRAAPPVPAMSPMRTDAREPPRNHEDSGLPGWVWALLALVILSVLANLR